MGRNILAVIVGYVAMGIIVMGVFAGVYFGLLGPEGAFKPDSFEPSTLWIVVWAGTSLAAALIGGIVCAKISKHSKGAIVSLIVLMIVLSCVQLMGVLMRELPGEAARVRTPELSAMESWEKGAEFIPIWIVIGNPVLGTIGVMTGAMMVGGWSPKKRDRE
ncbi:MAG: hypothetical protein ACX94C_00680 [Phycisphaerales bacterium]